MQNVTYQELLDRYGQKMAYGLLLSIEQTAGIKSSPLYMDEGMRWEQALEALNDDVVAA